MNGAASLIEALVAAGVEVCFANPGTSEMHLVEAIDAQPALRPVLCLFEGVCTGAADGYGRMLGRPAATLLHLGAGLANGVANLHNARRAGTPIVNVVGDHARHHVAYDAPLTADIEAVARPVSAWIRTARSADGLAGDGWDAVMAALAARPDPEGSIATLMVPADCAWGESRPAAARPLPARHLAYSEAAVARAAPLVNETSVLLLDGNALTAAGMAAAGRIARHTGCRVFSTTFPARVEGGPGVFPVQRLPYFPEQVIEALAGTGSLVLAGAQAPVSFFAYQNLPSDLVPEDCVTVRLNERHEDGAGALAALADQIGASAEAALESVPRPEIPDGPLSTRAVSQILAALAPDDCVVALDSGGGAAVLPYLQRTTPHTCLHLTGGAIGQGGPVALGAALACPDRTVFALLGDGGAMYTNQFLWSAAREQARIIAVIYRNRRYGILDTEYRRLGINDVGERAASLFDLSGPDIDWVSLAAAQGVPGRRADTAQTFAAALGEALAAGGPFLIEAAV